jgi:XTP/dITP diphosphohydrolase
LTGKSHIKCDVQEELQELQVVEAGNQDNIEAEFDVLFSMINYARFLNVNPEDALERTKKNLLNAFNIWKQVS